MIQAWRYPSGGGPAEAIALDAVATDDPHEQGLAWIVCEEPSPDDLRELGDRFGIHDLATDDLVSAGQRTKLERYEDHFHVALHDAVLTRDRFSTREIDVVFAAGWLLTVVQRASSDKADGPAFPIDDVSHRFERQRAAHGETNVGLLVWALLDTVVDRYFDVTDAIDDEIDRVQAIVFRNDGPRKQAEPQAIFELGRALVSFRRAVSPLREVLGEILRREVPCIDEVALIHLHDVHDHVLRVAEFVESQRDVLTSLRDADLSVASNQMNRSMQKLAAWGAILIVATLVTGILGMNFRNAPDIEWHIGFLVVLGVISALVVPMYMFFRHKDWL